MKKVLLLVLTVLALSLYTGCQKKAEEPVAAGPVSIDFWTTQTQSDRQATIQVLIDTYQIMNPNVTVKLIPVDENDLATQLNTAAAAKNMPALIEVGAENAVAFGTEGLLDEKAATEMIGMIGKDAFYAGSLELVESPMPAATTQRPITAGFRVSGTGATGLKKPGCNLPIPGKIF